LVYKSFIKKILFLVFFTYLVVFISVNFLIDPDMETRLFEYKYNKYKLSHSPLSASFLLDELESSENILVFGTSRSHRINDIDFGTSVLNMHAVYGNPYAVLNLLKQLNKKQIGNIHTIYYLLDDLSFYGRERYEPISYHSIMYKIFYLIKSTNFDKIKKSFRTVVANIYGPELYINKNGSLVFNKKLPLFDPSNRSHIEPREIIQRRQKYTEDTFKVLQEVDIFVKKQNLDIIYFTPPLSTNYISNMDYNLFIGQKERFLQNIYGYFDLTYIKYISTDSKLFSDAGHVNEDGKGKYVHILKSRDDKYFMTKEKFSDYRKEIKKLF